MVVTGMSKRVVVFGGVRRRWTVMPSRFSRLRGADVDVPALSQEDLPEQACAEVAQCGARPARKDCRKPALTLGQRGMADCIDAVERDVQPTRLEPTPDRALRHLLREQLSACDQPWAGYQLTKCKFPAHGGSRCRRARFRPPPRNLH